MKKQACFNKLEFVGSNLMASTWSSFMRLRSTPMVEKLSVRQGSSLDTLRWPLVIKSQNRERWEVEISVEIVVLSFRSGH